jgi:ABC-type transport system involved in cytochrome bd biosynthesis fused ATPase/permease subunit
VLDEPTAALDTAAAQALLEDILAAAADRTVVLITHRLEGLAQVDQVIDLSRDRIGRPRNSSSVRSTR